MAPAKYHRFIPKGILKSLVCEDEKSAAKMRKKIGVADIPVITQAYTDNVYTHITKNLTDIGKDALEEIHPWIINILVDWANFDQIICKCPLPGEEMAKQDVNDENNNNEEKDDLKEPDMDPDKHDKGEGASSPKISISKPEMDKANACSSSKIWKPEEIRKLIDLRIKNEYRFNKHGTKKKVIWQDIAEEINTNGSIFSSLQCEQKWKNLTKTFRDTVDHNLKSGNDAKQCPYFKEMEEAYGYKANVKPVFTLSSMPSEESTTTEDTGSDVESFNSSIEGQGQSKQVKNKASDQQNNQGKKAKKTDVLMFLETMNKEFKEEQKELLSEIKKQHEEKMEKEDKKLELMSQIIMCMKK